jgi:hypothetical protein
MLPRLVAAMVLASSLVIADSAAALDLSGSWSGSWESCTSGHAGPLRAEFIRCSPAQYRVDFAGRFFKILPFRYSVTLDVVEDHKNHVVLAGSSFLGRLFGTFTYRATADGYHFRADYCSKKDAGEFRLTRVASR